MKKTRDYIIASSRREDERLSRQAKLLYGGFDYLIPFLKKQKTILDVGCGTGAMTFEISKRLPASKVVGMDIDERRISEIKSRDLSSKAPQFLVGDATHLPFPENSFDLSHSRFVLSHLSGYAQAIREMIRVTRPGGTVLLHEGTLGYSVFPSKPNYEGFVAAWAEEMRSRGADPFFGMRLYDLLLKTKLRNVTVKPLAHFVTGDQKLYRFYMENFVHVLPAFRARLPSFLTKSRLKAIDRELLAENKGAVLAFTTFIASGRK